MDNSVFTALAALAGAAIGGAMTVFASWLTQYALEHKESSAEKEVLVLQGGGVLGVYQAGAYETLCDAGHMPSWVAGTSIGAINAAIIAGKPPKRRASSCANLA